MPEFEEIRVDAFAKLTLSLHITGTRADGYHELDATMVSINEPFDSLVLAPARDDLADDHRTVRGRCAGRRVEPRVARGRCVRRPGRDRACTRASRRAPGSAAARPTRPRCSPRSAAIPRSRRRSAPTCRSACAVGSPACAVSATCWSRATTARAHRRVATPPFGCSTVDVYRAWDELGGPRHETERSAARGRTRGAAADRVPPRGRGRGRCARDPGRERIVVRASCSSTSPTPSRLEPASRPRSPDRSGSGSTAPAGVALNRL